MLKFIFAMVAIFSGATAVAEPIATVEWYVSPYCPLSTARIAELYPRFERQYLDTAVVAGRFHFINISASEEEQAILRYLVCAGQQQRMLPLFLYIGNAHREGRPIHMESALRSIGVTTASLKSCLIDPTTDAALRESERKFSLLELKGVPSISSGREGFALSPKYGTLSRWVSGIVRRASATSR